MHEALAPLDDNSQQPDVDSIDHEAVAAMRTLQSVYRRYKAQRKYKMLLSLGT